MVISKNHPNCAYEEDFLKAITLKENIAKLRMILDMSSEVQKRRITEHFFYGKSFREIAREEDVNHSVVAKSVKSDIEKMRRQFDESKKS